MTINDPQLVTILVFVISGLFLLQTLFLLVFFDQVNRRVRKAERSVSSFARKASEGLRNTKEQLQQLSRITGKIPEIARELDTLLDVASEKARWADSAASRNIQLSAAHLEETNRRIDFALNQFTRQTSRVRKLIKYPTNYVSAIIHGAVTGVKTYTRHPDRGQPSTHNPDDEIFI